jgi:hypothetical protein
VFHPRDVFQELYKDACYHACREAVLVDETSILVLPSGFVKLIEDAFLERFQKLESRAVTTSADLHHQLLLRFKSDWLTCRSDEDWDEDCLICLRRTPQYTLPCGCCICENCVRVLGRRSQYDPWLFEVDSCFWCGLTTNGVVVKTLPPTAGVRVLTFDGGGVRGVATLQYMQLLQDEVDLPFPIQENFDVVFGTSIGKVQSRKGLQG